MKHYLVNLLCAVAPEDGPTQDALEFAIFSGWVQPSLQWDNDVRLLLNQKEALLAAYANQLAAAQYAEELLLPL